MKYIFIIDGNKTDSYEVFKERILALTYSLVKNQQFTQLKVVLTDEKPPAISIIPFSKRKVAVISVQSTENLLDTPVFQNQPIRGIYEVEEALPVAYQKNWPDGQPTPGVNLLTLFRRKDNLDYSKFIDRWHNGHTPLSLKLHPLWNYNRNVVKVGGANSEEFDGIVEEQVEYRDQLLNPFKFFGNPLMIIPNMLNVYFDVKGFIQYNSIETYLANEYWIKSS